MRWAAWIVAACAVFAAGMGSAQTPVSPPAKRIALIIGNADYNLDGRPGLTDADEEASRRTGHLPDLRNPLNDARDMRDELAKLGFDVSSYKENATRVDMITLLDAFGKKVREAGPEAIVFVYYSGHGMQIEGENFLLPAGAQLQGADFSQMSASAMQAILSGVGTPMTLLRAQFRARSGDGVNIVVLDACRNNPWDPARRGNGGRGRGLADQNWGLGQTLIAFSTEPGNTAYDGDPSDRNSPYTSALKSRIGASNQDLWGMFNSVSRAVEQRTRNWRDGAQRPWINSVTVPNVCLAGCGALTGAIVSTGQTPQDSFQFVLGRLRMQQKDVLRTLITADLFLDLTVRNVGPHAVEYSFAVPAGPLEHCRVGEPRSLKSAAKRFVASGVIFPGETKTLTLTVRDIDTQMTCVGISSEAYASLNGNGRTTGVEFQYLRFRGR